MIGVGNPAPSQMPQNHQQAPGSIQPKQPYQTMQTNLQDTNLSQNMGLSAQANMAPGPPG